MQLSPHANLKGLGAPLQQALCGQNMFDLTGADAKGQRPHSPVRRRVAVSADDCHSGLCKAELRADHMDDALIRAAESVERDPKLPAVDPGLCHQPGNKGICNGSILIPRGHYVIHGCNCPIRTPDLKPPLAQPLKGLGRRHLVDQVQVDIKNRWAVRFRDHHVAVPDLFE